VTEWISVKEQLPEPGRRVLVFDPRAEYHFAVTVAIYRGHRHVFERDPMRKVIMPTYWTPLPVPPVMP